MKEEMKQDAEKIQQQADPLENPKDDNMERILKEQIENLKLDAVRKVNGCVADTDLQLELHKIMDDVIERALVIGQAFDFWENGVKSMSSSVEDLINRAVNPTDAQRASNYKQLYLMQRIISYNLETALQHANSQIAIYESVEEPFASPYAKMFDTDLCGVSRLFKKN